MTLPAPSRSYVYVHRVPITQEVRYVGKGTGGRAWTCNFSVSKSELGRRGNRTKEHHEWLIACFNLGYTMADIVSILVQGLSNKEALFRERKELKRHPPDTLFNNQTKPSLLVLSREQLATAFALREAGGTYLEIAKALNVPKLNSYTFIPLILRRLPQRRQVLLFR